LEGLVQGDFFFPFWTKQAWNLFLIVSFNDAVHPDPPMPVSDHPTPISDKAHPHPNASEGIAPQTGSKTGTDVQTDTAQIKLSAEQKEVLRMVKDGKSVFFTGSAGTISFFRQVRPQAHSLDSFSKARGKVFCWRKS
jgi:hypothetical protein